MSFFDDSLVISFCGGRGSGKTLMLAYMCRNALLAGRKVYSNIDVAFRRQWNGRIYSYKSNPLAMEALITLDQEMRSSVIAIDEVNLWADSHQWQAISAQMIEAIFQQLRKRKLSFLLSVQDFSWLVNRLRWQTDLRIETFDLSYQYPSMERGTFFSQRWFDLSGKMSGFPYTKDTYDRSVRSCMFYGKPFWNIYDTMNEFGYDSLTTKYKIKKTVKVIDCSGNGQQGTSFEGENSNSTQLQHVIGGLIADGKETVNLRDLWRSALGNGMDTSRETIDKTAAILGIPTVGEGHHRRYILRTEE